MGLELIDRPQPTPGPADVLIRVTRAAICGTDLHIYKWDDWASSNMAPPVTIGHKFVGVVEAVGSQVDFIEVGTRVAGRATSPAVDAETVEPETPTTAAT